MTRLFLTLVTVGFIGLQLSGQCFPDRHSTALADAWISCNITQNPNPERTFTHWIRYDFGQVESIDGMKVWNANLPEFEDIGIELFALDYTTDGVTWTTLGEFEIPDHDPDAFYQGDDISGITPFEASQVVITAIRTKGGTCVGLSEIRFFRGETTTSTSDINAFEYEIYPNPTADILTVSIQDDVFETRYYEMIDLSGRILNRVFTNEKVLQLDMKGFIDGQYIIKVYGENDQIISEQIQVFKN
jgi:hypothetical protein